MRKLAQAKPAATCEKCGYWLSLAPGFAVPEKHAGCGGHYLPASAAKEPATIASRSTTPRTDAVALAPYKSAQEYMKAMTGLARMLERELATAKPEKKFFDDGLPLGVIHRGPRDLNSLTDEEFEASLRACRRQEIARVKRNWWMFWKG